MNLSEAEDKGWNNVVFSSTDIFNMVYMVSPWHELFVLDRYEK
jgi:hypothetical protein